jgi:6-phosphogluconolactonase
VTLNPPIINAARQILFLVTGSNKADTVRAVLEGPYRPGVFPAQLIRPADGQLSWLLDEDAASELTLR